MASKTIDQLIINSPYREPAEHWKYDSESRLFSRVPGRRAAGYVRATDSSRAVNDPGMFIELPLVNKIRKRVNEWRKKDYPGISGVTRHLLEHWRDPEQREHRRFFFCQLEAIETLIWLTEGPDSERVGIGIPSDGGPFTPLCSKMATGSGKTIVMAMLIAWQILNKAAYPSRQTVLEEYFYRCAWPDGEESLASSHAFERKEFLYRVQHHSDGPARCIAPGKIQNYQLAQAGLGF